LRQDAPSAGEVWVRHAWILAVWLIGPGPTRAEGLVRSHDPWTLQAQRLPSYDLLDVLATQDHRLLAEDPLALAVDARTGTQLPPGRTGGWHGHALADIRLAGRPFEGLELDLALLTYNQSASTGYRQAVGLKPGLAVYLERTLAELADDPLLLEVVLHDLGSVTLGSGLLFERVPMEGAALRLRWNDLWFRALTAGQVHGITDDLVAAHLGFGPLEVGWIGWNQSYPDDHLPQYLTLSAEWSNEHLGAGVEGALRLPDAHGSAASAAMVRADWSPHLHGRLDLHLQAQLRWYEQGIGPRGDDLFPATIGFSTPWREDEPVTQAFEAWWPSAYYHQLWPVALIEARWHLGAFTLSLDLEGRVLLYDDPQSPPRRLPAAHSTWEPGEVTLPDTRKELFYRLGTDWRPMPDQPHRFRLGITNRVPDVARLTTDPTPVTWVPRDVLVTFSVEVML
jgi:hypothetical protein